VLVAAAAVDLLLRGTGAKWNLDFSKKTKKQSRMQCRFGPCSRTQRAAQCISSLFSACGSIKEPSGLEVQKSAFWRKCQIGFSIYPYIDTPGILEWIRKSGFQGSLYLSRESLGNWMFETLERCMHSCESLQTHMRAQSGGANLA
jgi:hypothetical protein